MIMDFTISAYRKLLESLLSRGYLFLTFKEYISAGVMPENNSILILRHDVDLLPANSLRTAELEHSLGIKGTYYFRIVPGSYDREIIKKIAELGHETGYHYEDVDLANRKFKAENGKVEISEDELIDLSYESFRANLDMIRETADVKTICMHGSPLSKFDNKIIWKKYDYRELGLIGEPYLDIDWEKFGYLTDTGRKWNGRSVSVRDKVSSQNSFDFRSTYDIIKGIKTLPSRLMITVHPQRWNDDMLKWTKELAAQNIKNVIKKYFFVRR